MRAVRAAAGRQANVAGADLERELESMHERWRLQGRACIAKQSPLVKWISGEPRIIGKGGVDYLGTFMGRAIAYEAKSRAGDASFGLKDATSDRRDNERAECEFLRDFARVPNSTAFYLVRDEELSRAYVLHRPEHFEALLRRERISLRRDLPDGSPLVPSLQWHPAKIVMALATGRDLWDWSTLLFPDLSPPSSRL